MSETLSPERPEGRTAAPGVSDRPVSLFAAVQVLLLAMGWGGNAPALKFSLSYVPPFAAAGIRFLIGLGVIVLFAWLRRVPLRAQPSERLPLLWMGVLFAVQISLLNLGSAHTAASRQALLINSYPLFVPVLAHFFLHGDRLTWNKAAGTFLAFLGVVFIFGEKLLAGRGGVYGDLLVGVSAVLLAAKAVYTSALVRTSHPYQVLFWQMALAVPCFFVMSLLTEQQEYHASPAVALSLLYQGAVVAGLCFVGWTSLLQHYAPSRLSVGFFLTPAFGALFSYLLLGEPVTGGLAAGGAAILAGLLLVNRRS